MAVTEKAQMAARIARRVKELRTDRGWSQEKLARVADMSAMTVRRAEQEGDRLPDWDTLMALAAAFEIPFSSLLGFSTDRPNPGSLKTQSRRSLATAAA